MTNTQQDIDRGVAISHLYEARKQAYELSQRAATQAAIGLAPDLRVSTGQSELMGVYAEISQAIELLERW